MKYSGKPHNLREESYSPILIAKPAMVATPESGQKIFTRE